ncbi:branched-chain amino acid ABC transporter permease [Rhabdaerophilum calidifontis]|uniref:branched-chain amino acid ABC transporter permease n=1 Tax=Rhabdaerophilum calidifontis TaxID=2604328 RepID=UPI00123B0E3E|nr:branched-chain amino acid ABC transporter permease [Rhabdaerophilum calidifontis]
MSGAHPTAGPLRDRRPRLAGLILAGLATLPLLGALGADSYVLLLVTRVMIFAVAAISLDLILGYGAMVSFGHAAFMGIGAYAVGILATHGIEDLLAQAGVAILVSAGFAALTGAVSLRTKGVHFIMITLAFGQMAFFLAVSLAAYGGDDGLTIARRSTVLGAEWLGNATIFYYLVLAVLAATLLACRALVAARFGRVLRGTRENPVRMQAIGFEPFRYQLTAYVISGAICGLSGVLIANQTNFISPAYMAWQRSGELIVMVVLGGMGTLIGPLIGALAYLLIEEWLAGITEHWKMIFGPLLILVVLHARGGLVGAITRITGGRHG